MILFFKNAAFCSTPVPHWVGGSIPAALSDAPGAAHLSARSVNAICAARQRWAFPPVQVPIPRPKKETPCFKSC